MKQGKLFGKFSVIDAVALLLVILFAVALVVRLTAFSDSEEEKPTAMQNYTEYVCAVELKISGVNGNLRQSPLKEGDKLTVSGKDFGTVQSVRKEKATATVTLADGSVVTTERQDAYNYTVTVRATLREKDHMLRDSKNNAIAVGKGLSVYSKLFSAKGVVTSVKKI